MKSFYKAMISRSLFVIVFFGLLLIIASGTTTRSNMISNVNGVKSIEAMHIVTKYDNLDKSLLVKNVETMEDLAEYGPVMPVSFDGQMTAYKANCVGCTGLSGSSGSSVLTTGGVSSFFEPPLSLFKSNIPVSIPAKIATAIITPTTIIAVLLFFFGASTTGVGVALKLLATCGATPYCATLL